MACFYSVESTATGGGSKPDSLRGRGREGSLGTGEAGPREAGPREQSRAQAREGDGCSREAEGLLGSLYQGWRKGTKTGLQESWVKLKL